jgi:hypothetical protein
MFAIIMNNMYLKIVIIIKKVRKDLCFLYMYEGTRLKSFET